MRGRLELAGRIDLFIAEAERVNTTTARLGQWNEVPSAIADYLKGVNLPASLRVAPDPALRDIPWADEPLLEITTGPARDGDQVSVTGAFAGVAETGTLVLLSGPDSPTTLNFMPDAHIVVFPVDRIVGTYEEVWVQIRSRFDRGTLPRAVNWITGPSRTGDIEQTLLLGAHGPRLLHVLLVDV
jgi:L-lactate dehydrogenase complex protein LldG